MRIVQLSFLLLHLFFCQSFLFAQAEKQTASSPFVVELQYAAGKIAPVYRQFPKSIISNTVEIFWGYQTYGKQRWNKPFNYPRMGISTIFQELGNDQKLGQQISLVPTVYFSTAKKENAKFFAEIRYGLGLAFFTNPYNAVTNRDNKGAGSKFTWQFVVGANLRWNISKQVGLQLGVVMYHASNAHTQLPNVGVNNFAFTVGLLAYPFGRMARNHSLDSTAIDKKFHINFRFGSGWHERGSAFGPVGGKKYPVYTAAIYASRLTGKIFLLKAGIIYRYYPMYESFNKDNQVFSSKQKLNASAFIIFLGNEFMLGHFSINLEAGINVFKPAYKAFNNYYEKSTAFNYYSKQYLATRFGINYYLFDPYKHPRNNIFMGAAVSANFGQAEFLELNLGYVY